jgi:IS5 family transposase
VMQFMEDLTDRQAAEAVRGRIDWKYALKLELEDSGFDYSVLSEFRQRLRSGKQVQHEALQQARQQQQTSQWRKIYYPRAGIEGTISQAVTAFGLRQNHYRGLAKTRLQHLASATAINLKRLWSWFQGVPHALTRTSSFASLNLQTI